MGNCVAHDRPKCMAIECWQRRQEGENNSDLSTGLDAPVNLLETNDAMVWAEEFERCKKKNNWTLDDIDESLMLAWFANAFAAQEFKMSRGN